MGNLCLFSFFYLQKYTVIKFSMVLYAHRSGELREPTFVETDITAT